MGDVKFDFIYLPDKISSFLSDKSVQESLLKWSMKGNLKLKYYNFNQAFNSSQAEQFVEAFFKSPEVYSTLEVGNFASWNVLGVPCDKTLVEIIPCTVTSMDFFDKMTDPENNIVRSDRGNIIMKYEEKVGEFYSCDNLRACLIEEDSIFYNLYTESDRNEFIFRLFKHFALGGSLCQFEDTIKPYFKTVLKLYKELISVIKIADTEELRVRSLIVKVIAYNGDNPICPSKPDNIQNFTYLIIDPFKRQVAVLIHQYID